MNIKILFYIFCLLTAVTLSSCEIIGGIFEAGVWVGVIIVVLVIAGILWLIKKFF